MEWVTKGFEIIISLSVDDFKIYSILYVHAHIMFSYAKGSLEKVIDLNETTYLKNKGLE